MATAGTVKLPDLINRWIEVQKTSSDLERTEPLNIDAINLTLLLKTMGLRLQYLDFEADRSSTDNLTVSIKCNRSGMRADLSYDLVSCSCPEKTERESSFWEVQGTGPQVFSKCKNNTSSNLLPDVSESCALVSKAMLSNLLDFYQASIRQVKEEKVLHSPLKSPRAKVCVTSPGLTIQNPFSTPPAEGKCVSKSDDTKDTAAHKIEQLQKQQQESLDKHQQEVEKATASGFKIEPSSERSSSRGSSEGPADTKSNISAESVGINNKTHEITHSDCNTDKPVVESIHSPDHNSVPDEKAFVAMRTLVTSSPNEKRVSMNCYQLEQQHDRDQNVISYLQQARSQIDMALLLMKLNTTQDISGGSTVPVTPQHASAASRKSLVTPKFLQPRSSSLLSIGARKKSSSSSSLASTTKPTSTGTTPAGRVDTPRPSVAQIKSVATLRKTISMPSSAAFGSATPSSLGSASKKPATSSLLALATQRKLPPPTPPVGARQLTKPPISVRPISSLATGLMKRSSSASHITKK